ncbi:MAG: hypothetical protein RL567_1201 [Bacteroidota bacterium]
MFKKHLNWFLNSPTITTWFSYSTKAFTLFGVLPLVLKKISDADIVLWYLFSTIVIIQSLADLGFRQTFSRFISYAHEGVKDLIAINDLSSNHLNSEANQPNIDLLNRIVSCMKHIYWPLTCLVFILMITFGTWFIYKPIQASNNVNQSWLSWIILVLVSSITFYGKLYLNFLEGIFKIALVRRVEILTSSGAIGCSILVLVFVPTLLNLIIVNQGWLLISTFRDYYLCRKVENGLYLKVSKPLPFEKDIFSIIWQPAWRSGVSGLMSIGLTNVTGLIFAQIGSTASVASYLLSLRIITQIRDFSMAPFYSKLPLMAMLRAKNELSTLLKVVKKSMFLSNFVFILGVIFVGIFSDYLLNLINSKVHFVTQEMWLLLSFAFLAHRFGAMHMQVYLSTNHVISHIADGVSGIIYVVVSLFLSKSQGIYAIPIGMIAGYLGFYSWYAAKNSYKSLKTSFWNFEKSASLVPIVLMLIYTITLFFILND